MLTVMPWVYLDGKLVKKEKAFVTPLCDGFLLGEGLFESMCLSEGKILFCEQHLKRLISSFTFFGLKKTISKKNLIVALKSVVARNNLKNAALRLTLFKQGRGTSVLVFARRKNSLSREAYQRGFSVSIFDDFCAGRSGIGSFKSTSRAFYTHLFRRAQEEGSDEAVFLNADNCIVEGTRANCFCIKNNIVMTPPLSSGCLPGVTRAVILRLLKEQGIVSVEKDFNLRVLLTQEEAFLTNSLMGVMPIARINGQLFKSTRVTSLTQRIRKLYQREVDNYLLCGR